MHGISCLALYSMAVDGLLHASAMEGGPLVSCPSLSLSGEHRMQACKTLLVNDYRFLLGLGLPVILNFHTSLHRPFRIHSISRGHFFLSCSVRHTLCASSPFEEVYHLLDFSLFVVFRPQPLMGSRKVWFCRFIQLFLGPCWELCFSVVFYILRVGTYSVPGSPLERTGRAIIKEFIF